MYRRRYWRHRPPPSNAGTWLIVGVFVGCLLLLLLAIGMAQVAGRL